VIVEAKIQAPEQFGKANEKDFRLALRKSWQTVLRLITGKQVPHQIVFGLGGE